MPRTPRITNDQLVGLIDELGPINNQLRMTEDPLMRVELMWDFGETINCIMEKTGVKLHELLLAIYDPHATTKMSYITRDLGSYCYRIFKFFKQRNEIRSTLPGLRSYQLFREAIPLLFNEKYRLSSSRKQEVIQLIQSSEDLRRIKCELIEMKQQINPVKNPRNQLGKKYDSEKQHLQVLKSETNKLYTVCDTRTCVPRGKPFVRSMRHEYVKILMALANDSFLAGLGSVEMDSLDSMGKSLISIAKGSARDRSRFRKWVMDSNDLLSLAEAINSLDSDENYRFYRKRIINI